MCQNINPKPYITPEIYLHLITILCNIIPQISTQGRLKIEKEKINRIWEMNNEKKKFVDSIRRAIKTNQ